MMMASSSSSSNSPFLKLRSNNINTNVISMGRHVSSFKPHFLHHHHHHHLTAASHTHPHPLTNTHTQVDDHESIQEESSPNVSVEVSESESETETETQTVGVQFQLQRECSFGHNFLLTGDHPLLGSWDPNNAVSCTWSQGHIWTTPHLDIPVGLCIKFKFIMQQTNTNFIWQPGPDRLFQCFPTQSLITICEDWENPDSRVIIQTQPPTITFNQPKHYINMNEQVVESDDDDEVEAVPVLVPGLTPLPLDDNNETPTEPLNGAAMLSDVPKDLTLPESQLDSNGDIANSSNSNPRPEMSLIHENQESCEKELHVAEEQEHEATQALRSVLHKDIQWSNNVMQKFLNIFGIH